MPTVWCLAVAFLSPWVVGTPLTWLLHPRRPLRPAEWLWTPFVGLAAVLVVLQNLIVFADLPIRHTAGWFWLGVASCWAAMLATPSGRQSFRWFPGRIAALALVVFLAQGIGVLAHGVERFRGNMLSDQVQYVVLAEFLLSERYSTGWRDVGAQPWLIVPLCSKEDRLGQSVIHAFLAATTGHDVFDLYYPTQMLAAGLLVPAGLLLGRQCGLPPWLRGWTGLAIGLSPMTALLVGRCFLSHVMCMPMLIAFLAAAIRLSRGGGWRTLPFAMVALGLGFSVYTEFTPLFLGTAVVGLATGWLWRSISFGRVLGVVGGLALALVANPAAVVSAIAVAQRAVAYGPGMTAGFPLVVWLLNLWLYTGKALVVVMRPRFTASLIFGLTCFAAAACGLVWATSRAVSQSKRRIPLAVCYSLGVPPLAVWLLHPESSYVLVKLVWTFAPIAVLSVAFALHALSRTSQFAAHLAAGVIVVVFAWQSYYEQQGIWRDRVDNEPALAWNEPDLNEIRNDLRQRPRTELIVALDPARKPLKPATASTAICYDGRHHRIWIAAPHRIWQTDLELVPAPQLTDVPQMRAGTLVVVQRGSPLAARLPSEVLVSNNTYQLLRLTEPVDGSVTRFMMTETVRR